MKYTLLMLFTALTILVSRAGDIQMLSMTSPSDEICGQSLADISFSFRNNDSVAIDSFNATFILSSPLYSGTVTETVEMTVSPGSSSSFSFSQMGNFLNPGPYSIIIYSSLANDIDSSNDTLYKEVSSFPVIDSFPYKESFESVYSPWLSSGMNSSWSLGSPDKGTLTSATDGSNVWATGGLDSSFINNVGEPAYYNASEFSELRSPCFDLSSMNNIYVQFDAWYETEFGWDGCIFQFSTDGGQSWANSKTFTGSSNGWKPITVNLSQLAGESNVRFRFPFSSDGSKQDLGLAIDNFRITSSCDTSFVMTGIYSTAAITTARLFWENVLLAHHYEIRGRKIAPEMDTAFVLLQVNNTLGFLNVPNLHPESTYEWQMRAVCDSAGTITSRWSEFDQFTTLQCRAPKNTSTVNILSNKATLIWDPIDYPQTLGYKIIGGQAGMFNVIIDIPGASASQRVVNVAPSTSYNWGVLAACFDGGSVVFSDPDSSALNTFTSQPASTFSEKVDLEHIIYPNPSHGFIRISGEVFEIIEIFDMTGRLMMRAPALQDEIDISQLESSIYSVLLHEKDGGVIQELLILKND